MKEAPKQVIVIRKDLNMSAGKLAAQVSHASMGSFFNSTEKIYDVFDGSNITSFDIPKDTACSDWTNGSFAKVVVYVKSEQALLNVLKKAQDKNLPCALITDEGRTEFNGVPTNTCLGIGPCYPEDFEGVTSKLRLFDGDVIPR